MFHAISSVHLGAVIAAVKGTKKINTVGICYVDDVTLNITVDTTESQDKSVV